MKLNLFISFIFSLILFGCNSEDKNLAEKEVKSRIKNQDLKKIIPHLLEIHELTFKNVPNYKSTRTESTFIKFLASENYLYAHVSALNCDENSKSYYFMEEMDSSYIPIFVDAQSFEPEKYFDLNSLNKPNSKQNKFMICDDWYYTAAKFQIQNGKLVLEKITTTFDNSCFDCFYDKSDSAFLQEIGIYISEPEPEPIPPTK